MNENSLKAFIYVLVLGTLFGLLSLMRFVVPHYEPEDGADNSIPTNQYEIIYEDDHQETPDQDEDSIPLSSGDQDTNNSLEESPSSNSEAYFKELKNNYQTAVLNTLPPGKPRSDVIIRYYKHPPDGNRVYSLKDLGFYIHERPVDQNMADYESNSIFYGDSVKQEDLLIVAYTLIKSGMPIKSIKPSLYHDGWKYNAIEIGADSAAIENQTLTVDELRQLSF